MFGTTAPDSTQNTRATFSEHFSGFTLLKNLKAPESGWRLFNALSASTEAGFGPRQSARKAPLFISLLANNMTESPQGSQPRAKGTRPDLLGLVVPLCSSEGSRAAIRDAPHRSASQQRTQFSCSHA